MASGELTPIEGEQKNVGAARFQGPGSAQALSLFLTPDNTVGVQVGASTAMVSAQHSPETHDALVAAMVAVGRDNNTLPALAAGFPLALADHPDNAAVDALAALMKGKLAKQRAKGYGGWDTKECTQQRLSDMLRSHVGKGDPVDVANFCAFLVARGEGIAPKESPAHAVSLSGAAIDTLIALVEHGPLEDGDVPSKAGRDELLTLGFATKVVVKSSDGWQAATFQGRDAYKARFGPADTMKEARANRLATRTIRTASRREDSQ